MHVDGAIVNQDTVRAMAVDPSALDLNELHHSRSMTTYAVRAYHNSGRLRVPI